MEEAGKEEAVLAKAAGDVDANGTPCITVIADGAWSKRSYNVNYNAASGVACIVGQRSGKLLYLGVRNKYCCVCARAGNLKIPCPEHLCYRNWSGTSTGMESDIIVEGFKNSINMHGLKYTKLVGDGDSSVHKKLLLAKPYGNLIIEKIECKNHLYRNFASKLRELSIKSRSVSTGEIVPIMLRRILLARVQQMSNFIKKATEYRIKEKTEIAEKIASLRSDILNSPYHTFGEHEKCHTLPYLACSPELSDRNYIIDMKTCGLYNDIVSCLHRLIHNSNSLLLDMNNNDAEHYNSVLCKFTGGKRINFCQRGSYEYRCGAAAISFNSKEKYHSVMHKALKKNSSPRSFKKKFIARKIRTRALWKQRRHALFRRRKQKHYGADNDYGATVSLSDAPDMIDESLNEKKEEYLRLLQKTPCQIANIERATIGQAANPKWVEERAFRLSASKFGSVCKMRKTTSRAKKVQQFLYNRFCGNAATTYGAQNEDIAIKDFEKAFGLTVDRCGFFVHSLFGYLGASPDGLIGTDGVVEVKCPINSKLFHPIDAVKNQVIKFIEMETNGNMSLKRNHDYYYQVQGQLEVTNRQYCYFVVWTPKGMLVEKICRDIDFWRDKMKEQLKCFFLECMLLEIVNSRTSRGLPIRSPVR